MDKIINLTFDSQGTKTDEEISEIRQGDIGVVVSATFAQKNNSLYTARLNLTRNDDKRIVDVLMDASSTDSTKYSKKLDSAWYFAKAGRTSITVFLTDANGNQVANGQVVVSVQKTDFSDEDVVLDPDEYANLIALISSKLNITDGIISKSTVSALGNLNDYNVGQVFYIKNDGKIYQLNSSYNLDVVVDLYLVNFTILNEVEVVETKTATQVKKTILLKNTENQTFYDFEIVFDVATTTNAGLMSASDKAKLSSLPTSEQITQQHANLHNEVVAEKTRATGVEANKEDKVNKKTVINDSTANDTNYASVKAVRDFVNDSINNVSAYYITKNATGDAFDSVAQLTSATTFYSGGQVRTPTRNDYCIVRVDENHANATTRYIYQGSQWEFQYIVNEEPLTDAQLQAINSGITSAKVSAYDTHIADTNKHIQSGERAKWNEVENKQIKNKTFDHIPRANELEEEQVGIVPSIEAPDLIIGNGLEVLTDAQTGAETLKVDEEVVAMKGESYTKQEEDDLLDEKANDADLSAVAKSGDYNDLTNKPTIPSTPQEVGALPNTVKYGAGVSFSIDQSNYKITLQLKDQDGNNLGQSQVIDLPLESVVVSGSYDSVNKKIILTLQNGNTIDVPVSGLVSGLATTSYVDTKFNGTLKLPSSSPTVKELVGIGTQGEQIRIQVNPNDFEITGSTGPYQLVSKKKLYRHEIKLEKPAEPWGAFLKIVIINNSADPINNYTKIGNNLAKVVSVTGAKDNLCIFLSIDIVIDQKTIRLNSVQMDDGLFDLTTDDWSYTSSEVQTDTVTQLL